MSELREKVEKIAERLVSDCCIYDEIPETCSLRSETTDYEYCPECATKEILHLIAKEVRGMPAISSFERERAMVGGGHQGIAKTQIQAIADRLEEAGG